MSGKINIAIVDDNHFLQKAIAEEVTIRVHGEEALKDLKIIEAIYEAAKTGKRIVLNI